MTKVFAFGFGYSALAIVTAPKALGFDVVGTVRTHAKIADLNTQGFDAVLFQDGEAVVSALDGATHLLISVPPQGGGDLVLQTYGNQIQSLKSLTWIGYLSTIGVYGDHAGGFVDETTPTAPKGQRGQERVAAENAWNVCAAKANAALDVFRLAGIYGPGRNPFARILDGTGRRVLKPGQVFNRIHVDDIAQAVLAAIERRAEPASVRVFNVSDDEPASQADVIAFAARLLDAPLPKEVSFAEAILSPMAASFWQDNKRVKNDKIKRELGVRLSYPTYREGLAAIASAFRHR